MTDTRAGAAAGDAASGLPTAAVPTAFAASHDPDARLAYRPDIDGLRAVAVIAVVVFHAFPDALTGGFAGVDVFFVISGYLITSLLHRAHAAGRFSVAAFYAARVRRIFPALALVLAAVLALGWQGMLDLEFRSLGKHAFAGAGFVANFSLWNEAGYFDTQAELKPLLHLWSLGIEEQFYLAWPLLLALLWRHTSRLAAWIAALGAASFALCLAQVATAPEAAFYSPAPRAWELFAGAWLACAPVAATWRSSRGLGLAGAAFVLGAFVLVDAWDPWPGARALLPVLGTLAIIASGRDAWLNRAVLAHPVAVGIGLVSYPLYLWHWPLLACLRLVEPGAGPAARLAAVAIAGVLAWATFRFVETPIRRRRLSPAPLVALMVVVAGAGAMAWSGALRPWSASFGLEKIVRTTPEPTFPWPGWTPVRQDISVFSRHGGPGPVTLLVGDSTLANYAARMETLVRERAPTRGMVIASSPGCPPLPDVDEPLRRHWCKRFMDNAFDYAQRPEVDTVLIAAHWQKYFQNRNPVYDYTFRDGESPRRLGGDGAGNDAAIARLAARMAQLRASGKRVVLVLNLPVDPRLSPGHLVQRSWRGFSVRSDAVPRAEVLANQGPALARLRAAGEAAGAIVVDPMDTLCDARTCAPLTSEGRPKFVDDSHLTVDFAREHATYLDVAIPP
ncbi:MAG: acyltransferase family protein [Arenimonas sp.]